MMKSSLFASALKFSGSFVLQKCAAPSFSASARFDSDVLNNVTSLTIKGEFHAGATEVLGIDNIQVTAVPEPESAALMLAGLGLLAVLRRKR